MVRKIKKKKLSKRIASKAHNFKLVAFFGFLTLAAGVTYLVATQQQDIRQLAAATLVNCDVADISLDSEEQEFLRLLNEYRVQNGLGTLELNEELTRAAHWKTQDMAKNRYFSHTDSLRRGPYTLAKNCGHPSGAYEIIAAGGSMDRAADALSSWKRSSGHNKVMLEPKTNVVGIARYYDANSVYRWYWTALSSTLTNTPTPTQSNPPTNTPTPIRSNTPTPTKTPTPTATKTPTPVPTTAASTPTSAPTTPTSLIGDADGDGRLTFSDYRKIFGCLYKSVTGECSSSDVDGNGEIEPEDLMAFLRLF